MTLGNAWGFVPNDKYKSSREVIHKLVEVIAQGGNLLLGVGPTATGVFPEEVSSRLKEIGEWTSVHSEAIYGTRSIPNFQKDNVYFVEGKQGEQYAFVLLKEGEEIPSEIQLPWTMKSRDQKAIELSTSQRQSVRFKDGQMFLYPSKEVLAFSKSLPVVVFRWK
jgi:alpha-L-fucosidase